MYVCMYKYQYMKLLIVYHLHLYYHCMKRD